MFKKKELPRVYYVTRYIGRLPNQYLINTVALQINAVPYFKNDFSVMFGAKATVNKMCMTRYKGDVIYQSELTEDYDLEDGDAFIALIDISQEDLTHLKLLGIHIKEERRPNYIKAIVNAKEDGHSLVD